MLSTVFVVTPSLNCRNTIDRTIQSVVSQAGNFRIRYHVKDGGSTDGTLDRLRWWDSRLRSNKLPHFCRSIDFTYSSEADLGVYDAIIQGFSHTEAAHADFMTWINAGDILLPGAIAFVADIDNQFENEQVSWLGGSVCEYNEGRAVAGYDRYLPTSAIRAGACDGIHWDFVPQQGVFFRHWLWSVVEPNRSIREFRAAGDWNLWRLFAQRASFVQWTQPLAAFNVREGQLVETRHSNYAAEIDSHVARQEREKFLETAGRNGPLVRNRLIAHYPYRRFTLVEEAQGAAARRHHEKHFGRPAISAGADKPARSISQGKLSTAYAFDKAARFTEESGFIAYDHDWQYPAITEQHAFAKIRELGPLQAGAIYVAYPWATLMDKMQTRAKDLNKHLATFRRFCRLLPQDRTKVTVAQHILARRYRHVFEEAGIDHVFWSHATKQDVADTRSGAPRAAIHPFPLFPVQRIADPLTNNSQRRPILYSFVGARADRHYPTPSRNWIIDHLANDARGQVVARDGWHYGKLVYETKINDSGEPGATLTTPEEAETEEQFKTALSQSIFSLCPSGTGPNSIRLWEALCAGSIPVIMSDSWAPPGSFHLWEAAAVFCDETEEAVQALPQRLATLAGDDELLAAKRRAGRQLCLLYGPDVFVYDILQLGLRTQSQHQRQRAGHANPPSYTISELRPRPEAAVALLRRVASELLLDYRLIDRIRDLQDPMGQRVIEALAALREEDAALCHYTRVAEWASALAASNVVGSSSFSPGSAPQIMQRRGPKVFLAGTHSHRTPLAYAAIRSELPSPLRLAKTHHDADIILTGSSLDLQENAGAIGEWLSRKPRLKLAVMSEEPTVDHSLSGESVERERKLDLPAGRQASYTFISHETSSVYEFGMLPYLPLRTDELPPLYAALLTKYLQLNPDRLLEHWRQAPVRAAFFSDRSMGAEHLHTLSENSVSDLSEYRTLVASMTREAWTDTLCVGSGWGEQPRYGDLGDRRLDKLATLTGRVRLCSAIESVHQRCYISEGVFDAFAVGAVPVYNASPRHRILELVPNASMINTYGLTPKEAAAHITTFEPDRSFAEAWLDTCARLRARFADTSVVVGERRRLAAACLREMELLV